MRTKPEGTKLNGKTVGKGCFARGGRACDQHDLDILMVCNVLRDVADSALLKGLLNENHIRNVALTDLRIQISDRGNINQIPPLCREHQLLIQVVLLPERRKLARRLVPRKIHENPLSVGAHLKLPHIVRGRHHITVEVIIVAFQAVNIDGGASPEVEELHLVLHALAVKQRNGIIERIGFLRDRTAAIAHLLHLPLDLFGKFIRNQNVSVLRHGKALLLFLRCQIPVKRAEISIAERKFHLYAKRILSPRQLRHCLHQHQGCRPYISQISRGISGCNHRNHPVPVELFVQLAHFPVKIDERNLIVILRLELAYNLLERCSLFILPLLSVYKYCRHVFLPSG